MHISIHRFEVFIIFDGFICFFSSSIWNLDRDPWTWIWLFFFCFFCFIFSFSFPFVILLMLQKNLFFKIVSSKCNNFGLFTILCATYKMDLVHMFHEFSFVIECTHPHCPSPSKRGGAEKIWL